MKIYTVKLFLLSNTIITCLTSLKQSPVSKQPV